MSRENLKRARSSKTVRADRAMTDRDITQDREYTDAERVDMLRRSMFQSHLPDLPKIPGFHTFWATTTNSRDPIHGRLRLGYTFILAHEYPDFESISLKTGQGQLPEGCIVVNEMVAMKLPLHLYEAYMREVHHDAPLREQEAIYNNALATGEEAAQSAKRGGKMKAPIIEAGTEEMGQAREPPVFSQEDMEG